MNEPIPEELPNRWFEYWRRSAGSREERKALSLGQPPEICAAHEWVSEQLCDGDEHAIEVVVALARAASGEMEDVMVGVSAIEDLIYNNGDAIVADLVDRARDEPALARALGHVSLAAETVTPTSLSMLARFKRRAQD